ncbi:MAG: hypothetical protein V9F03_01920 [Microthrixaceae bacterium]
MSHRDRNQSGFLLPVVMLFMLLGTAIALGVLSYATTSLRSGQDVIDHNRSEAAQRDALEYVMAIVRDDMSKGVAGQRESATVAGVTATCVGAAGSGQASGTGRADRVVDCSAGATTITVRFFDRGGARAGVVEEVLRRDVG